MADSVQTFLRGMARVCGFENGEMLADRFQIFEADGIEFEEPSVHANNPVGACPTCKVMESIGIDEDLVIPNKSLSVYQDAVAC
jgi:excinuclease ABC subunit A